MGQLGDTLRDRRISLGITLDAAEEHTKIRGKLLEALENGDYARLPNPGYVQGYVSSYARYLELDPVPLLAMYRSETGAGGRRHQINVPDEAVAPRGEQHAVPWRAALIAVAVIAGIALVVWIVLTATRKPATLPPVPSTATQQSGTSPAAPGVSTTLVAPSTIKVTVSPNGASTLKVTLDGKPDYNGTLTGGQSREFTVTDTIILKIGKPTAVSITKDGKPVASAPTVTIKAGQTK